MYKSNSIKYYMFVVVWYNIIQWLFFHEIARNWSFYITTETDIKIPNRIIIALGFPVWIEILISKSAFKKNVEKKTTFINQQNFIFILTFLKVYFSIQK